MGLQEEDDYYDVPGEYEDALRNITKSYLEKDYRRRAAHLVLIYSADVEGLKYPPEDARVSDSQWYALIMYVQDYLHYRDRSHWRKFRVEYNSVRPWWKRD
jgi:hypothetical protein